MSEMRQTLEDSARKVFPNWEAARDASDAWAQVAQLGWFMVAVPETMGGLGLGDEGLAIIFAELGRALVPGPVLTQFLVIEALVAGAPFEERDGLLERAMSGEIMTASLAIGGRSSEAVMDADKASHILLRREDVVALISQDGAQVKACETWDVSRRLFDVAVVDDAQRYVVARGQKAAQLNDRLDTLLCIALAGDALGGARAALSLTLDHLKGRSQFDRPLAMFQALKHRVADLKMMIDTADAFYADRTSQSLTALEAGELKNFCCAVYRDTVEDAIQLHGGVGLTTEYAIHRFFKRAFLNCALGGDADYWNERAGRAAMAESQAKA